MAQVIPEEAGRGQVGMTWGFAGRLPQVRVFSGCGSAAGCSHPLAGPGRGRGHGAGRVSGRGRAGPIRWAFTPPGGGGQTWGRPRARPAGGRSRGHGWCGQAADLAVAEPVAVQGQQPAGGGDLGDVLGPGAAPGDDRVLGVTGGEPSRGTLDRLDQRLPQQPRPLLGHAPAGNTGIGFAVLGGQPRGDGRMQLPASARSGGPLLHGIRLRLQGRGAGGAVGGGRAVSPVR